MLDAAVPSSGRAEAREGHVRLWHSADMATALMHVRFEGNNGHDADVTRCLLMTQSGHVAWDRSALDKERYVGAETDGFSLGGRQAFRCPNAYSSRS